MSSIICDRCGEFEEVTVRTVVLPFICQLCTKDSDPGVPCQSALDSVQADVYDIQDAHNADVLDQFNEDTKLIDDLRLQLEQANLNVQILEETIEDLENQLTDLRLDICNVMFRTHF